MAVKVCEVQNTEMYAASFTCKPLTAGLYSSVMAPAHYYLRRMRRLQHSSSAGYAIAYALTPVHVSPDKRMLLACYVCHLHSWHNV